MKFREFKLKDDITQLEYVVFRTKIQEIKPEAWENVQDQPLELFYYTLVSAAIEAGWIADVVEANEYDETTTWEWNIEYLNGLNAGSYPLEEWGDFVFKRWIDIKTVDPN